MSGTALTSRGRPKFRLSAANRKRCRFELEKLSRRIQMKLELKLIDQTPQRPERQIGCCLGTAGGVIGVIGAILGAVGNAGTACGGGEMTTLPSQS